MIYNSTLISGTLDKNTTGGGDKTTLFYVILRDYGKVIVKSTLCNSCV